MGLSAADRIANGGVNRPVEVWTDLKPSQRCLVIGNAKAGNAISIPLVWGFLCQGGVTPFCVVLCIPFFCSTRAASILPSRPHISIAVARRGGQGRRFFSAADSPILSPVARIGIGVRCGGSLVP